MGDSNTGRQLVGGDATVEWRIRQVLRIEADLEGCSEHRTGKELLDLIATILPSAAMA